MCARAFLSVVESHAAAGALKVRKSRIVHHVTSITVHTDPTLTHRLWGCVGEVVGSPRADRCVLRVCDDRGATAFGVRPRE